MLWSIRNEESGHYLGVYRAETAEGAVEALNADANASEASDEGLAVEQVDPAQLLEERADISLGNDYAREDARKVAEVQGRMLVYTHPGVSYWVWSLDCGEDPDQVLHGIAAECWNSCWPLDAPEYPAFVVDWKDGALDTVAGGDWGRWNHINLLAAD